MTDRLPLADLSDPELERKLIDLGPHLFPVTPDLATQVRQRLEGEPAGRTLTPNLPSALTPLPPSPSALGEGGTAPFAPRMGRRAGEEGRSRGEGSGMRGIRVWLAAAFVLMAIALGLALFPQARNAIADRLGLRGVLMQWVDEILPPERSQVGAPLMLGRPVTLDEAREAVRFPILVPTAAGFDAPGEIYLLDQGAGEMVSFVYPAGPALPESGESGVGALLTQFQGAANRNLIEKGLRDDVGDSETRLESVTVGGEPGFWISGAPHGVFFVCYNAGECREERYRLAGDVLLWEHDGMTLRLESALGRTDALAIAESVRAPE